ncbi:MAG: S-adenosylmethionine:tRNA ribosyltransferase-isomerase, partial [Bacteroidales bacterium]|nr:S-adenosylmethionine:tRNA ribosyltransferase-isomerase [Bacteroidales bacterium]
MRKPGKIPIEKYDYPLPDDRIAKYPLADRDMSKILVYRPEGGTETTPPIDISQSAGVRKQKQDSQDSVDQDQKQFSQVQGLSEERQASKGTGSINQKQFSQVPELLEKSDRLYFNATRVVQARLIFKKSTGARIEIFCLEPFLPADHQLAFSSTGPVEFVCLIGNSKKWKEGKLNKNLGELLLTAEITGRQDDKFIVRFSWNDPGISFDEVLERSGSTPIPPYLNREAEAQDAATYQ